MDGCGSRFLVLGLPQREGEAVMVFNGLSKSDLVVYNALLQSPSQVSISELANTCNCHWLTVWRSLRRLEGDGLVIIKRDKPGVPNSYRVVRD